VATNQRAEEEPIVTNYSQTRIEQADIDRRQFSAEELFQFGNFMFDHEFTIEEGLGNALPGAPAAGAPRPDARRLHNGKFGGPDSTSCATCHTVGGEDGAGGLEVNLLQDGDGVNLESALVRNPIALQGVGWLQQLGIEMSDELGRELVGAKDAARRRHRNFVQPLSSKGTQFGSLTAHPDGTVDFSGLEGVDRDLVVKPLGWKGRVATIRRFVEGGFQVHLGLPTEVLIAQNCGPTPIPQVVGNGPDCRDPDMDGVYDEITEGQLTAMAVYMALQQVPIRIPPTTNRGVALARAGEITFGAVGCTNCHTQRMVLDDPVHEEAPDLTGGRPFAFNLSTAEHQPNLPINEDGTVDVELWSDLKRHDMGASLADPHATFGVIAPNLFMTTPLWGVNDSPPYLHDGRAATLHDAILLHDGEAKSVRDAFAALPARDQNNVVRFLSTLRRDPNGRQD
jgi:mono/diheme cytochrome c family protein